MYLNICKYILIYIYIMIKLFKVFMSENVIKPVNDVLMSGNITQGKQVEKYETALKEFLGNKYVLTLNSATAGLTLALRLLKNKDESNNWPGFNEDDVVLTPALTCFATTASILANNVKIRWLDVDLETANIDLFDLKNKLSKNTKVIYLVHWGGNPVDLDSLKELQEYSLQQFGFKPMIVEDCAHAFGAEYNGKKIGNSDNICVFSTQAIKHLTTGDGGIITLPNKQLYDRCKLLRWFGIDREKRNYKGKDFRLEHDISEYGYKYHMNDINATLGLYNLPHINELLEKNRTNGRYLNKELKNIEGISLMKTNNKCNSAYWLYTIRVKNKTDFIKKMNDSGIMTSQVHNRNDINSCVKQFREELPNLNILENELVCIPVGWWLTKDNLEYIVKSILTYYENL
jgi:dTDP-4-amino-4,6-dideoxygalactose transaminase